MQGGSKKRKAVDTSKIIVSVACGSFHTLCLDDEGNVITFGLNNYGQCGTGDMISPVTTPNVIACERLSGVQIANDDTLHHLLPRPPSRFERHFNSDGERVSAD